MAVMRIWVMAVLILLIACMLQGASGQQMEISYGSLDPQYFFRPQGSNVIYAVHQQQLELGCSLPPSYSRDQQKQVKWQKDDDIDICGIQPRACDWVASIRGIKLHIITNEKDEQFKDAWGSGIYKCSYGGLTPASVQVWVISSGAIRVNDDVLSNKTHLLPSDGKSVNLECLLAGVTSNNQVTKFRWFRDSKQIYSSDKYVFTDKDAKLEIKQISDKDAGVYMCEAETTQNGGTEKMHQYVILQGMELNQNTNGVTVASSQHGANANSASVLNGHWRVLLFLLSLISAVFNVWH